jgi:hypothetical protein
MLASAMIGNFTIETTDGAQVLLWTGKEGNKAVLLFPTQEAAATFLATIKVALMHVIQLTPENIEQWVAKVRRFGAGEAILNPTTDGALTKRSVADFDAVLRVILGQVESK